jgi:hypothetical protein
VHALRIQVAQDPTTLIDQLPEFQCTHSAFRWLQDSYHPIDQLREFQCTHSHSVAQDHHPTDQLPEFQCTHSRIQVSTGLPPP